MKHPTKALYAVLLLLACSLELHENMIAQNCTSQSQMTATDRDALAGVALELGRKVLRNDQSGIKAVTISEYQSSFSGISGTVAGLSQKLNGDHPEVEQIYMLDSSEAKMNQDGSAPDTDFICPLTLGSGRSAEAYFSIHSLPPGRYAFALIEYVGSNPWELSLLLRQSSTGAPWQLAGLFPRQTLVAGHDGLWFWAQGRAMTAKKQPWSALIYYLQAQQLLQPADFVSSTHLEKLREEALSAFPTELSDGLGPDRPLVIKGSDGKVFRITAIRPDSGLPNDKVDVALYRSGEGEISDQMEVQKRNRELMSDFLSQHPDLRTNFHGMWVYAEAPGRLPVATEAPMDEIH